MKFFARLAVLAAGTALLLPGAYVTALWSTPGSVGVLDNGFNMVSSFNVPTSSPNGIDTDGTNIWVATFLDGTVRRYDFSGNLLSSWTDAPRLQNAQGLALVGSEVAVANNANINFFDAFTGAFTRSIANTSSSDEGLAFDGTLLWSLDDRVIGLDPLTGAVVRAVANPALGCGFGGTGLAAIDGSTLAAACGDGSWYVFSSFTGAVSASGNNQLPMYGLGVGVGPEVPEPGTYALMGLGICGLALLRRRK